MTVCRKGRKQTKESIEKGGTAPPTSRKTTNVVCELGPGAATLGVPSLHNSTPLPAARAQPAVGDQDHNSKVFQVSTPCLPLKGTTPDAILGHLFGTGIWYLTCFQNLELRDCLSATWSSLHLMVPCIFTRCWRES